MKHYRYDLHIHSALSPCADRLMSPNNILNMAHLIGLEIIAITDHNSLKQTLVSNELSQSYNFLYIFGVEISTIEGLHVLCYFQTEEHARQIDQLLEHDYNSKPKSTYSYNQTIFDEYDNELFSWNQSLHQNSSYDIQMLHEIVNRFEGIMILAHVERYHDTLLSYLVDFKDLFHYVEINASKNASEVISRISWLKDCRIVRNSDSHQLLDIGKHQNTIPLEDLNLNSLFQYLRGKSNG